MSLRLIYKRLIKAPFILMADTVLTEVTVMSDYYYEQQNFTNMPELPKLELKIKERGTITVFTSSDYYSRFKTVEFTVSDTEPIENAEITLNAMIKLTDSLGKAKFKLRAGTYNYTITKEGYEPVDDEIIVSNEDINEAVTMSEIVADPIQDLVDEYKSYVTSQGGVIGVSDAALYAEYEDMVTKGEIDSSGNALKKTINVGLFGYKLSSVGGEENVINNYFGLAKIGGNYPVLSHFSSVTRSLLTGGVLNFSGDGVLTTNCRLVFDPDFAKDSFYIEFEAHIRYVNASLIDFIRSSTDNWRSRIITNNIFERQAPGTGASPIGTMINDYAVYQLHFDRFNDGDDKVSNKLYRDGSHIYTWADTVWNNEASTNDWYIRGTGSQTCNFKRIKISLK